MQIRNSGQVFYDFPEIGFRPINVNEYRFQFSDVISDFLPSFCRYSLILMSRFMRFLNKSLITPSPLTRLRPFFLNLLDVKATINPSFRDRSE